MNITTKPFGLSSATIALFAGLFIGAVASASAATGGDYFLDPALGGTTDLWTDLSGAALGGTGGFPGNTMWTPHASQTGSNGNALLEKVSNGTGGGPYAASGSMYFGGFSGETNENGGTLAVTSEAISGLANVVFQIEIGEAWTYDFHNHELPTFTYRIGEVETVLAASYAGVIHQEYNGTVEMPSGMEDLYNNTYLLQWDLSGIGDVDSFAITFTGVQHAQLYALRLDQGTVFSSAIPEPSAFAALAGLGSLGVACLRRRRRNA